MKYIVYIDRLFLLQAVQTLALLLLTGTFLNWRAPSVAASALRLVLGSGAEALFFCAVFLLPGIGSLPKRLLLTAGSLVGLLLIFRIRLPGLLLRAAIFYCASAFLLAGAVYAVPEQIRERAAAVSALMLAAASGAALFWKRERKKREQTVVTAELIEGNVRIVTDALIDSGNTLYDPIGGKPVSVVERGALEGRIDLERPERFRLIPYHTLGSRGLMQAIEIEKLKVKRDGQEILLEHTLLALYNGEVTRNGSYRLILHPALLQDGCRHRRGRHRKSRFHAKALRKWRSVRTAGSYQRTAGAVLSQNEMPPDAAKE